MLSGRRSMDDTEFRLLRDMVYAHTGVWYPADRRLVLENRLSRRLFMTGSETFLEYYRYIEYGDADELQAAVDAVTNNETYFFREVAQLLAAVSLIEAAIAEGRSVRVLSAGCASGEEPYTLAMLLHEQSAALDSRAVEIVGVDINTTVLERARAARYGSNSFRGTEGRYLDWYFEMNDGLLELDSRLRQGSIFAHASILDARRLENLGPFDLVLCRNVLIYFDDRAKRAALEGFHSVLKPGGHLFLGHAESLYRFSNEFEMVRIDGVMGYRRPSSVALSRDTGPRRDAEREA